MRRVMTVASLLLLLIAIPLFAKEKTPPQEAVPIPQPEVAQTLSSGTIACSGGICSLTNGICFVRINGANTSTGLGGAVDNLSVWLGSGWSENFILSPDRGSLLQGALGRMGGAWPTKNNSGVDSREQWEKDHSYAPSCCTDGSFVYNPTQGGSKSTGTLCGPGNNNLDPTTCGTLTDASGTQICEVQPTSDFTKPGAPMIDALDASNAAKLWYTSKYIPWFPFDNLYNNIGTPGVQDYSMYQPHVWETSAVSVRSNPAQTAAVLEFSSHFCLTKLDRYGMVTRWPASNPTEVDFTLQDRAFFGTCHVTDGFIYKPTDPAADRWGMVQLPGTNSDPPNVPFNQQSSWADYGWWGTWNNTTPSMNRWAPYTIVRAITAPNVYILLFTDHNTASGPVFSGRVVNYDHDTNSSGCTWNEHPPGRVMMFTTALFNNGRGRALSTDGWYPPLTTDGIKTYFIVGLSKQAVLSELGTLTLGQYPLLATSTTGKAYGISGRVTVAGNGLANVQVSATWTGSQNSAPATVQTDPGGNYIIYGLANGPYSVTATLAGYTISPATQTLTLPSAAPNGYATNVNFTATTP